MDESGTGPQRPVLPARVTGAPRTSLERLAEGNERFLETIAASPNEAGVAAALAIADPYAIVLGCSDSRVPPEAVFNETVGRLFVVRVVAHVAGRAEMGSIEYAVARWNCPLIVVLGHTQCGGIAAALDRLPPGADKPPDSASSMNLGTLVASVKSNLGWISSSASPDPWLYAVTLNVRRTIEQLTTWSPLLRGHVQAGRMAIVGAIYHVENGAVEFLEA